MTLNKVLEKLSSPNGILTLPISHLLSVRTFNKAIKNGALEPSYCNVFKRDLLYFSYGGVFHRYGQIPTNEVSILPVAILFKPSLLNRIDHFFPYDTGAAKKGRYSSWSDELMQWDKYRVFGRGDYETPSKLVYYIYGSNEKYLTGQVLSESKLADSSHVEPLANLIRFLREDLTSDNTDYRQRVIECQATQRIDLREAYNDIVWIGLPKIKRSLFYGLCKLRNPPSPPRRYYYRWRIGQKPADMAAKLEAIAETVVDEYLDFEDTESA